MARRRAALLSPFRRPSLLAIGDSHAAVLDRTPGISAIHLGPVTLHRLGRPGEFEALLGSWLLPRPTLGSRSAAAIVSLAVRDGDSLVLFAGEIDVRSHYDSQWPARGSVDALSRELAEGGVRAVVRLAEAAGARAAVSAVTPASIQRENPKFPFRGTRDERVAWTTALNDAFRQACAEANITFVDHHAAYADDRGLLREELSDGSVHIDRSHAGPLLAALHDAGLLPGETPSRRRRQYGLLR